MFDISALETGLTVGEIAGFIAGVISTLHLIFPLIFAVVLLGLIQNGGHNAATWSNISRHFQGTLWPDLLRADAAAASHVRQRVKLASFIPVFGSICLAVAAFLTPKPLVEHRESSRHIKASQFQYVQDPSFYGQGTLSRPIDPPQRVCGWYKFVDCPNSIYGDSTVRNMYKNYTVVNSSVPSETFHPYTNSTSGNSVAGPMDIEFRNYYQKSDVYIDNAKVNIVGSLQPLETFLLNDQYRVIEGLIVDTMNGGIGFRNHTLPVEVSLGAEWTEDILWIVPETACTPVNLSLHFSISKNFFYETSYGYMRDDGGFANLDPQVPSPRWDGPDNGWQEVFGAAPNLQQRSQNLAWWNNHFTAKALNASSSYLGKRFTGGLSMYAELASPSSITISNMNGDFLDIIFQNNDTALARNFTAYGRRCSGYDDPDASNSTKPYVRCGYLYGVPYPSQGSEGQFYRYDLNSNWTQELFTCASAMKASVKTVSFSSNATNSTATLNDLSVLDVQPKDYSATSLPIWAVEKVEGYNIEDINLFWGLIDSSETNSSRLETRRAAELYLPAANHQVTFGHLSDSFAAGMAFGAAWNSVYEYAAAVRGVAIDFIPSYSGENNYGLTLKYRELSKTPEGAAKILNLIWTDLSSFITVGTRTGFESQQQSGLSRRNGQPATLGQRDVRPVVRVIGYTNILFAIPAFIVAFLLALGIILTLLVCAWGPVSWRSLNHYMNQTSIGRAVTQITEPKRAKVHAKTKDWSEDAGQIILEVPGLEDKQRNQEDDHGEELLPGEASHHTRNASGSSDIDLPVIRRQSGSTYTTVAQDISEEAPGPSSRRYESEDVFFSPTQNSSPLH